MESTWFATYTCDPSGDTATPSGLAPTATVATTRFESVSITDTVLSPKFVTYTHTGSIPEVEHVTFGGPTATPVGFAPTGTVATTVFDDASITDTVWTPKFATYTRDPSGVTATPRG